MKKILMFNLLLLSVIHLQASKTTLLHEAAAHGNIKNIIYIFDNCVQSSDPSDLFSSFLRMLNAKDSDDQTPYDCACNKNQERAAKVLSSLRKLCLVKEIKEDASYQYNHELEMVMRRFVRVFLHGAIIESRL